MVAVIKTGHSIRRILNYNENKVKEGVAECVSAVNYPMEAEELSFNHKLNRLLNLASLNENVTRNSVHVSLNFDPSEKLSQEQLKEIADLYMQKIGFGEQPYLVYQHFDSGHPHIHLVSVKVRADGSRIDTQNIGRNQSEKARQEIEKQFALLPAEKHKRKQAFELKPVHVQKVQYGKSETKRAITYVLEAVLMNYKYSSLPELNAVLKQYHVVADPGSENSRVYQNKGLVYRILNEQGEKVGVPIKASDFYNKPTLKFLEERFHINEAAKQPHKARVKNAIDLALLRPKVASVQSFIKTLEREGIHTVLRQNSEGMIYGITYVDHQSRCVFNGSTLGKSYSAKAILERCVDSEKSVLTNEAKKQKFLQQPDSGTAFSKTGQQMEQINQSAGKENILDILTQPEFVSNYLSYQLKKGRRKRKRRKLNTNQ